MKAKELNETYIQLAQKQKRLEQKNSLLTEKFLSVVGLYEITKEVCSSLQEEEVFAIFKEKIKQYLDIKECRIVTQDIDPAQRKDYYTIRLDIRGKSFSLMAKGVISKEDEEKFRILTQQLILGLKRARFYHGLQELSITDSLTQTLSRRYFLERFEDEIRRCQDFNLKFSFLMVDIDHFKKCNDSYGHLVGDAVIKEIARTIKQNIRQIDLLGRYGGEEFSVLLTETDRQGAFFAAERIRKNIEENQIEAYDERLALTVSIGISCFPEDAKTSQGLIDKSDCALYHAKQTGRNRICSYGRFDV
jgi:diguanylate cyclase (GGDEF)-like protein